MIRPSSCTLLLTLAPFLGTSGGSLSADPRGFAQEELEERAAKAPPEFEAYRRERGDLDVPSDLALLNDGGVLVLEAGAHRVRRFDAEGREAGSFGARGSGAGQLLRPGGIAADPRGRVWVADTGNDRLQVFRADGTFERSVGSRGTGRLEFESPSGVDAFRGILAVADSGNRRIQIVSASGESQRELTHEHLRRPLDVAFGPKGELYVCDGDTHRVVVFGPLGKPLRSFGSFGGYDGQLDAPGGIAFHAGHVYVADRGNHRVQIFTPAGEHVGGWGLHAILPRESGGKLHYPERIAIDAKRQLAFVLEPFEDRLQVFGIAGEEDPAGVQPLGPPSKGGIAHFGSFGSTRSDLVFLLEPETHGFFAFDLDGSPPVLRTQAGGYGQGNGQFVRPSGMAYSADGRRLVVGDAGNRRLQEYRIRHDPEDEVRYVRGEARFARALDLERLEREFAGRELDHHPEPGDMTFAVDERLWMIDRRNDALLVFDRRLRPVAVFGDHGTGDGEFLDPTTLVFDPAGEELFVVDGDRRDVQVFGQDGKFLRRVEGLPEDLVRPFGVAFAGESELWITDRGAHRLVKLDLSTSTSTSVGEPGLGRVQFHRPAGVLRQQDGRMLVIDYGNHRVLRYDASGSYVDAFGARWFLTELR